MSTILTKLVPGTVAGTYVEEEGTIVDLINPLVPAASESGAIAKLAAWALLINLITR